jgi:hypothetical protein
MPQNVPERTNPTSGRKAPTETTTRRMPADHVGVLLSAAALMIIGWAGLALLITRSPPRIGAELWMFFVLLHLAITGTVLPVVRYLNVSIFAADDPPPGGVIVRQSVWIGLLVVICGWLQILRALSLPVVFFLALMFIVLEVFLRSRELNAED